MTEAGPLWRRARIFGQSGRDGGWLLAVYLVLLFWGGAGVEEYYRTASGDEHPYPLWAAPLVGLLGGVVLFPFVWPLDLLLAGIGLGAWWLLVSRTLPREHRVPRMFSDFEQSVRKRIEIDREDAELLLGLCEPGSTLERASISAENLRRFLVAEVEAGRRRRLAARRSERPR